MQRSARRLRLTQRLRVGRRLGARGVALRGGAFRSSRVLRALMGPSRRG